MINENTFLLEQTNSYKLVSTNKLWLLTLINTIILTIILILIVNIISAINKINTEFNNDFDNDLTEYISKFKKVLDYFCQNMITC